MTKKFDAFISHASEDIGFVEPLMDALKDFGLNVWHYETHMLLGEHVVQGVNRGISESRYGVVVFSESYETKPWTRNELAGLFAMEARGELGILVVLHNTTDGTLNKHPLLAGRFYTPTAGKSPDKVAAELLRAIRPDIHGRLAAAFSSSPHKAPDARRAASAQADGAGEQLSEQLFNVLCGLKDNPEDDIIPEEFKHESVIATQEAKGKIIAEMIGLARSEVRLICYSMTTLKDPFERGIRKFLGRGDTSLRVLLLNPDSHGFREKTALEAGPANNSAPNISWCEEWRESIDTARVRHAADIRSGVGALLTLQKDFGKDKVSFNFYTDTPVLYGFCFDKTSLLVSSYFINPKWRGYYLPFFRLESTASGPARLLRDMYLNWFDVKSAGVQSPGF